MRPMALLCVLLVGLVGIAAPTITPTPWRYGVIYWVGEVPENPEAYLNMATNWAERVFVFWNLTPLPRPTGDWRSPREVPAASREEAREILGPDFPLAGVIVPGPEEGSFWALSPLLLGEREIRPLTMVVFAGVNALQEAFCRFGTAGFFVPSPTPESFPGFPDRQVAALVTESEGPVVVVPLEGRPPFAPNDDFLMLLAHEMAHWATLVWAEEHGLSMDEMPRLLTEGLADYTLYSLHSRPLHRLPAKPVEIHSVSAAWARRGGLADVPGSLVYSVGLSLVDFLVRKEHTHFVRVLNKLPEWLEDWPSSLAQWEVEWRDWLGGEVDPGAVVHQRILLDGVFAWAQLVEPLFPDVWVLVRGIEQEEDVGVFWDYIFGPIPTPSEAALEEMRKRECVLQLMAQDDEVPPEIRGRAMGYLERLRGLWDAGDGDGYAATFIEALRSLGAAFRMMGAEAP
ncbi:MAG: hypothetical protein Kow0097_07520 [Candidatus Bipolaricaulota bacterium]|nr:hypothetical protein [Candidatus Bipolaricaulota bacterium]